MATLNECHASTSIQVAQLPKPVPSATVTASAKGKRRRCESDLSPPISPPNPTPHFQLHSPDAPSRYCPRLVQRMQTDTCYRCRQQGHWARDCPLNSPNTKSHSPITEKSDFPKIYCRCGHGFCEVRTAKNDRNHGRSYYVCPIKRGKKCKDFVKWCDGRIDETDLHPPPYKFPICSCGAGVCRKEREPSGPNEGRYYFACPIGEDHGACDFHLWEDTLLDTTINVPVKQNSQKTLHDFWESSQLDKTNINELDNGGGSLLEHSKRMRITGDSQDSSVMAVPQLPNREDAVLKGSLPMERGDHDETTDLSTPLNHVDFPEIKEEPCVESRLSTPSRIRCRQREFQREISTVADADFGPSPMGWLGWLVFCQPTRSLKFPPSPRFFCCVYPSLNIFPNQEGNRDSLCGESNQLLISNPGQHVQVSTGCHNEVSPDVVSPTISLGCERKPLSKAQRQRQVVSLAQLQLLLDLESLNPLDYESMREAAESTFDLLNRLSVDYKQFSEHVWEFINSAASLAEIQNSIGNYLSPEEHNQRYEEEKVRLANIRDNYVKSKALLEVSNQRSQSLREEASSLKARLHEIEDQLTSCELETSKLETHLGDINGSMSEAERSLKIAAERAGAARKLMEDREAKQSAAKTALEKAKLELEK